MNLNAIRALVGDWAGVSEDLKWGADHVFSVDQRMFCVLGMGASGVAGLTFKVDDDEFLGLTDRPGIVPAPYLARARWVQLAHAKAMPAAEVRQRLRRSYELVAGKLSKRRQRELGLLPP